MSAAFFDRRSFFLIGEQESETSRKFGHGDRQAIRPDFVVYSRGSEPELMDVKTMSRSERYSGIKSEVDRRAVNNRGRDVDTKYQWKAKKADEKYCGWNMRMPRGPVHTRLVTAFSGRVRGLVVGFMGEVSDGLRELMGEMADRMANKWRERGARDRKEEKATAMARIKRVIGITAVRGMARLKIERSRWVCLSEEQKQNALKNQDRELMLEWSHRERLAARYEVCVGARARSITLQ